jgi:anti-sigma B factor antagonist
VTCTPESAALHADAVGFASSIELVADRVVVRLAGELDLAACDACRRRLAQAAAVTGRDVLVDLSPLTFIDSEGLAALLESVERLREARSVTYLVPQRGPVRRTLDVAADLTPRESELGRALAAVRDVRRPHLRAVT